MSWADACRAVVVGAVRNRRSDHQQPAELPLYLDKWPKLSTNKDLEFFIDAYREEVANKRSMTGF